jgi:hypothetical protein
LSCGNSKKQEDSALFVPLVDNLILNKTGIPIEFPSLYTELSEGLPDSTTFLIGDYLIQQGFAVIESGRGNYPPRGPRIVTKVFKRQNCSCTVSKIYYSTTHDGYYEMAERIKCE